MISLFFITRAPRPYTVDFQEFILPELQSGRPHNPFATVGLIDKPIYFIHFWASWCGPCRTEFPSIFRASARFSSRLRIVTINLDDEVDAAKNFIAALGLTAGEVIFLHDTTKTIAQRFGAFKLPETFILDSQRRLIRRIAGSMDWEDKANLDYFLQL
jgi:thiol-disulfide isomerase/thioredoxin